MLALGPLIRFSRFGIRNEMKASNAEVRSEIAGVRTDLKDDIANVRMEVVDLRHEMKENITDLRAEMKLDFQANRSEIITDRRMLGRFALNRHGEDWLPLAPLTDALEPLDSEGDATGTKNGSD